MVVSFAHTCSYRSLSPPPAAQSQLLCIAIAFLGDLSTVSLELESTHCLSPKMSFCRVKWMRLGTRYHGVEQYVATGLVDFDHEEDGKAWVWWPKRPARVTAALLLQRWNSELICRDCEPQPKKRKSKYRLHNACVLYAIRCTCL